MLSRGFFFKRICPYGRQLHTNYNNAYENNLKDIQQNINTLLINLYRDCEALENLKQIAGPCRTLVKQLVPVMKPGDPRFIPLHNLIELTERGSADRDFQLRILNEASEVLWEISQDPNCRNPITTTLRDRLPVKWAGTIVVSILLFCLGYVLLNFFLGICWLGLIFYWHYGTTARAKEEREKRK
jgi:hypothetical protein